MTPDLHATMHHHRVPSSPASPCKSSVLGPHFYTVMRSSPNGYMCQQAWKHESVKVTTSLIGATACMIAGILSRKVWPHARYHTRRGYWMLLLLSNPYPVSDKVLLYIKSTVLPLMINRCEYPQSL